MSAGRSLGVFFALCLLPGGAGAAELEGRHHIELLVPDFEYRDVTACEQIADLAVCYSFVPRVDPAGKLTGSGSATVEGYFDGVSVSGSFPVALSGSIRGVAGDGVEPVSKLKLVIRASAVSLSVDGEPRAARLSLKASASIDHSEASYSLEGKRSLEIEGLGRSAGAVRAAVLNTAPLEIWDLWLTLDPPVGRKLAGTARLSLQSRQFEPLTVRGSHSARGGAKLSLTPGADLRGVSLKLARVDVSGAEPQFQLRFKLKGIRGIVSSAGENASWSVVPVVAAFPSEGSYSEPIEIVAGIPHDGTVGPGPSQRSWYVIRGLTPNTAHTIELARRSVLADLYLPTSDGSGRPCKYVREGPDAVTECPALSDASGELRFMVFPRNDDVTGGEFQLSFRAGGTVSEGEWGAPLEITLPHRGSTSERSYYRIGGLTPGATYTLHVDDVSGGEVTYYTTRDGFDDDEICSFKGGGEPCSFITPASGDIWVAVGAFALPAEYTIRLEDGGTPNEGLRDTPLDLTGALPHAGTMQDQQGSYYRVTGLAPGSAHTLILADIEGAIVFELFGRGWHSTSPMAGCVETNGLGQTTRECVAQADSSGALVLRVTPLASLNGGGRYTVQIAAGGLPNEGLYGLPLDVTGQLPRASTTYGDVYGGGSNYLVRGLGNRPATVSVAPGPAAGCLALHVTSPDGSTTLCTAYACGVDACTATPIDGQLSVIVSGERSSGGQSFTLDVD